MPVTITDDAIFEIGADVLDEASMIFDACDASDDFCHQGGLVFGGTNRVTLGVHGWFADPLYCTPRFLEAFRKLMQ